ncbi:hypothetical protein [Streptomyces chrestomyceticus]|uniref:hypothetical protein n=1 Tax=Streptomyces chrestomyceticus TaxID=68185 RepID=UPI0033C48923
MSTPTAPVARQDSIQWQIPEVFHSLGLEMEPAERTEYLEGLAAELWASGTDFQRQTVSHWYQQIAEAVAQDGALEAAFCILRNGDRITTATLAITAEPLEAEPDVSVTLAGLVEALSAGASKEVMRVDTEAGPAVVALSSLRMTTPAPEGEDPGQGGSLDLAQVVAYLPCPIVSQLLVLTLCTPTIEDLPDYVGLLAQVTDTVQVNVGDLPEQPDAARASGGSFGHGTVRDVFG